MADLTPEGLRARANDICLTHGHSHEQMCPKPATGPLTSDTVCGCGIGEKQRELRHRLIAAFTALVAEARLTVLQEVNQLACGGLSSSLSIKGMLAMHDRHVVAEAWRAQREADVRAMCLRCREDVDLPVRRKNVRGWWHVNFSRGESWTECRASAIRAQEETP